MKPILSLFITLGTLGAQGTFPTGITAAPEHPFQVAVTTAAAVAAYQQGMSFFKQGQYTKAVEAYTEAIRLDRRYADAFNNRGFSYQALGQYNRAIEDYNEALILNPTHAVALCNRGYAYNSLSQAAKAKADFIQASKLAPKFKY